MSRPFSEYLIPSPPCSPGPPGNSRQAGKPSRLVASWVNKFCLAYLKQCIEILCMAAEKPWAGYFGCGKAWATAIFAAENQAHAHILEICHADSVFLIHRKPSEEQFCEARIP